MRNTIRKVIIVVPVLMTSCHVSLKPNTGPVHAHTTIPVTATPKAIGRPVTRAVHLAKRTNHDLDFVGLIRLLQRKQRAIVPQTCQRPTYPLDSTSSSNFEINWY